MTTKGKLFVKASKAEAKARVAVTGPSGSGKTYWSLLWAETLADGGDVAVIDTERSSASLYADRFNFYTLSMTPPYHPDRLVEALRDAEEAGFSAIVIDSLTHFWNGAGGVLEIVDEAKARFKGNSHAAWQVGTPLQQRMVDSILGVNAHICATMRAKTEWAMQQDDRGRVAPVKIGLAPQQRDMIEYEFTLMLDIDVEHRASVSKTRCDALADRTFSPDESVEAAQQFQTWLRSGNPMIDRNTRDRLQQQIATLTTEGRQALISEWRSLGLPKIELLSMEQATEVQELVASHIAVTPADSQVEEVAVHEVEEPVEEAV